MTETSIERDAKRLCIYIGESDRWRGKPLYAAILEKLKTEGLAGATVMRGVAGFGAHSRIHSAAILRVSEDLPLRIEVIDSADKIARAVEFVAPMVFEGLITIEGVQVVRYTHRYLNPLPADKPVSEVMIKDVVTLHPQDSIASAWREMLEKQVKAMPVVDDDNNVVGMLTDEDILDRTGILLKRLGFAERLDHDLLIEEMERLRQSPLRVAEIMSKPAITVRSDESLGLAASRMKKEGIKRLPVVDKNNALVGVISRLDVLRQIYSAKPKEPRSKPPTGASQTVQDIMSWDVPVIDRNADLATLVSAFVSHWYHRVIVVDELGRAIGLINDADVVSRIQPAERAGVLKALQRLGPIPASQVRAHELMSAGVLTVPPDTSLPDAARLMVTEGRKWLVIVDQAGKPVGLLDRQGLLREVSSG